MRCGWGPYFRRTFEVQAGNSPLQGQSKPPAKLVVLIVKGKMNETREKEKSQVEYDENTGSWVPGGNSYWCCAFVASNL